MDKTTVRGERSRLALPLGMLLLTPLYYVIPWERLGAGFTWVAFSFFLAYTIVLPGEALARLLSPRRTDAVDRTAAAMLFGLSLFLFLAFAWTLSGVSLGTFANFFPAAVVVLAAKLLLHQEPAPPMFEVPADGRDGLKSTATAAVLLVLFVLLLRAGISAYFTTDTLDHVAYVSEIVEDQRPFPTDAFYLDPGQNGEDIRKGLLHAYYGYAAFYLDQSPLRVLTVMNAVLAIALIVAAYSMTLWFFGKRSLAILSALLFVLAHDGGLAGNMMSESYYSHRFGLAFFWFFVVFGMRFLQGRKRRDVWLSALFAFSACATHVFFSLLISLAGVTILLWKVCFPGRSFRDHAVGVLLLAAAVAVAALPYMLFRYLTAFPAGGNELHDQVQGVVLLGGPFYVAQPLRLIRWFGPVGIVSFAAVIPLWALMKKNYGLGFLVASLLMIPIVLFNPILLPPLHELMTYLVFRMNNLCPFFALAAFFLYTFFHDREFRRHRKVWSMLIAAAMLGAVVIAALPIGRDGSLSRERQIREQEYSYLLWKEPLDRLDATLPARSVIASDPLTSYSITAFTPYHVVCTLDQHAPPNDALLEDRVRSARAILSPYVSMKQTTELLARHGATHVILNNHQPERFLIEYWLMDRDIYPESYEKFSAHPELFTPAALADEFVVFEWNGQQSDDDRPPSNAFKPLALPDNAVRVGRRAGDAILEGIHVGPDHVERGGTVAVEVIWSGTGDYRLRNYNVSIRFDHRRPDVPFGGAPFPKIMRKLKEQLIGARYRFREQHKIRNGFLSPDTWAPGELIIDATNVAVPTDLVPGRYAISVKLFEEIHQPNLRVRDFLYDDDMYQGIQVSEIVIE